MATKIKITADQLDSLGKISDTADNFSHASQLHLPAALHAELLSKGMVNIRDQIRKLYVEVSGENPWADEPSV